ncbi:MAG TPA: cupin domain-containing protein [Solirubrobacterales bacterium]|jgi:mannose-6-phosphate isomerase-like protein (cupin superfamily)
MDYTIKNLKEVEDMAASQGLGDVQEARFAHGDLDSEQSGLSLQRVKPGNRHPIVHRHKEMEEIYVVVSGSGRIKLDDDIKEIAELDAIRVAPSVVRSFEAGDDGLEFLAFSPRAQGDAEIVEDFSWD